MPCCPMISDWLIFLGTGVVLLSMHTENTYVLYWHSGREAVTDYKVARLLSNFGEVDFDGMARKPPKAIPTILGNDIHRGRGQSES